MSITGFPRNSHGEVVDENPQGRGFVDLGNDVPIDVESEGYSPSVGETPPETPMDQSQPDMEMFPPESVPSENPTTTTTGENEVEAENVEPHEVPVPDWGSDDEDGLCAFGDDLIEPEHDAGVWEIKLATESFNACDDIPHENDHDPIHTLFAEHVLIASNARKQMVEVQYRHLSSEDQKLFDAAKQKEIKAWIDHGTVQKVTRGTLKPEQIMRCRWILTWKAPEVGGVE